VCTDWLRAGLSSLALFSLEALAIAFLTIWRAASISEVVALERRGVVPSVVAFVSLIWRVGLDLST
jgi:hypothetical protein